MDFQGLHVISQIENEIRQLIVDTLDLEDISPDVIDVDAPLFGEGLGLDSIDALELGVEMQKKYGIKLDDRAEEVREHFHSVRSLAAFVAGAKVA